MEPTHTKHICESKPYFVSVKKDLKQAPEDIKERAYLHLVILDLKLNTPPQYGTHGSNTTSLHLRRSNDVLPDLLSTIMASQLVSQH